MDLQNLIKDQVFVDNLNYFDIQLLPNLQAAISKASSQQGLERSWTIAEACHATAYGVWKKLGNQNNKLIPAQPASDDDKRFQRAQDVIRQCETCFEKTCATLLDNPRLDADQLLHLAYMYFRMSRPRQAAECLTKRIESAGQRRALYLLDRAKFLLTAKHPYCGTVFCADGNLCENDTEMISGPSTDSSLAPHLLKDFKTTEYLHQFEKPWFHRMEFDAGDFDKIKQQRIKYAPTASVFTPDVYSKIIDKVINNASSSNTSRRSFRLGKTFTWVLNDCKEACAIAPDNPYVLLGACVLAMSVGAMAELEPWRQKLHSMDINNNVMCILLAYIDVSLGDMDSALCCLNKIPLSCYCSVFNILNHTLPFIDYSLSPYMRSNIGNNVWNWKGILLERKKDYAALEDNYKQAILAGYHPFRKYLEACEHNNHLDQAEVILSQVISDNPRAYLAVMHRLLLRDKLGKHSDASKDIIAIAKLFCINNDPNIRDVDFASLDYNRVGNAYCYLDVFDDPEDYFDERYFCHELMNSSLGHLAQKPEYADAFIEAGNIAANYPVFSENAWWGLLVYICPIHAYWSKNLPDSAFSLLRKFEADVPDSTYPSFLGLTLAQKLNNLLLMAEFTTNFTKRMINKHGDEYLTPTIAYLHDIIFKSSLLEFGLLMFTIVALRPPTSSELDTNPLWGALHHLDLLQAPDTITPQIEELMSGIIQKYQDAKNVLHYRGLNEAYISAGLHLNDTINFIIYDKDKYGAEYVQLRLKQAVLDLLTDRAAEADHEWKKLADPVFRLAISNALYNYIEKSIVAHHEETINARKDERNQVIRDLAHSVKNLVATVVGPLDQLSKELPERRVILEKALRGARLIREVVNAVNLSSSGSLRDFANDAESAVSGEGTSISEIIMLAIESSVENMFDGKYFPEFVRKYFPSNIYNEAYSKWQEAKNSGGANINEFLNQYMFTLSVNIDNLAECRIADKLGSRTKCLILFQEIILNAVKYTAFANRQNRFIEIILEGHEKDSIHLRVKNSRHAGTNIKTSRIGRNVINNFTELLRGEIKVKESDDLYEVNLTFPNIFNPAIRGGILKEAKKP